MNDNARIFTHQTVMLESAVESLKINPDGIYVDGTFGRGGHSRLILEKLSSKGQLFAFDRDLEAVMVAEKIIDPRFTIVHAPFSSMYDYFEQVNLVGNIDGILLDLGVSSPQIDNSIRGFSFMNNGPLDMRMDQTKGTNARELLYTISENELANILWLYGEEKNSRKIARKIKELAQNTDFENFLPDTFSLVEIIKQSSTKFDNGKNPATRSFQAIRIAVNDELGELERCLDNSIPLLKAGGILSVISFHSLEDRIVKNFLRNNFQPKPLPKDLPVIDSQIEQPMMLKKISKAIMPSKDEVESNIRSRSSILRWGIRSEHPFVSKSISK